MSYPNEPDDEYLTEYVQTEYAAILGRIISKWAAFEYMVDAMTWDLASIEPPVGACLTSQFSNLNARFNALLSVALMMNVSRMHLNKMNKLKDKALGYADRRNRIVHDPWYSSMESNKHYRLVKTARSRLEFEYKAVPLEELNQFEIEIRQFMDEFRDLRSDILQAFWKSSLKN
jgi:hypothetical protein